jgi:hypothetical protein
MVMREPTYDDMDTSDYEHFRRRSEETVEVFKAKTGFSDAEGNPLGQDRLDQLVQEQQKKLADWRYICDFVHQYSEEELPADLHRTWRKMLFHLRFVDEFTRIQMAHQYVTQIEMGYSPRGRF